MKIAGSSTSRMSESSRRRETVDVQIERPNGRQEMADLLAVATTTTAANTEMAFFARPKALLRSI